MRFDREFSLKGFGNRVNEAISQICSQSNLSIDDLKQNKKILLPKDKKIINEKLSSIPKLQSNKHIINIKNENDLNNFNEFNDDILKPALTHRKINSYNSQQQNIIKVSALKQKTTLQQRKMG